MTTETTEYAEIHFEDLITLALEPLEMYLETIENVDEKIALVGAALLDRAMKRIKEGFDVAETDVGKIMMKQVVKPTLKGAPLGTLVSCNINRPMMAKKETKL